jgi:uncharacterized protein YerC
MNIEITDMVTRDTVVMVIGQGDITAEIETGETGITIHLIIREKRSLQLFSLRR